MESGFTKIVLSNSVWDVPKKYQNLQEVGSGTFGMVCSAFDTNHNKSVAIKKLCRPFHSVLHAIRTYRELKLLKNMKHKNVIGLLDVFTPSPNIDHFLGIENESNVYLVTHLMASDLSRIMKFNKDNGIKLNNDQIQYIVYQILCGLKYIHSAGILHRDLKPSNIAVNNDCGLKILDFGLARITNYEMTGYVTTRLYRAPEIMFNWMHYDMKVDIWSLGCIMAELITSRILFPAKNQIEHLNLIMALCGTPDEELMQKILSVIMKDYIRDKGVIKKKNFRDVFSEINDDAIDLLEKMLELDPDKRISSEVALTHPYFAQFSDLKDDPITDLFDESFEENKLTLTEWKNLVYNEIIHFIPIAQIINQ